MYRISLTAAKAKDLNSLWRPLFLEVLKVMEVDAGTLMMLDGDLLVRKTAEGLGAEIMKEPPIPKHSGGVSWKAVLSKQEVVINDLESADITSRALKAGNFHALVSVPVMVRDQVIGVISVFTHKERNFSEADLNLFKVIANQAGLAIISIKSEELLKENKKRLDELSALNQISQSVATLFDFGETLFSIIGLITQQLKGDIGVITLFDHKEKVLKALDPAYNLTSSHVRDFYHRSDEGIMGRAFCKGVPQLSNVIDKETKEVLKRAKIEGIKCIMVAPLRVKSQTLGVIHIFSRSENNFHPSDLRLFNILSSQAAVVVNSSYMYREIEEERKKDDALLSSIGEGVIAVDEEGKIILVNLSGEKLTGYREKELLGKNVEETFTILDGQGKIIDQSPIKETLGKGKPLFFDNIYTKRRSGETFPARLSIAPTFSADDENIGAIIAFSDITKEKEVEEMKQELISIATHELRAPITAFRGYLEMVLDGDTGKIGPETKDTLEEMTAITGRLADLVDDLLNVSRIEQGRIDIKPVKMNLSEIIEGAVKELSVQAKDKGLNLVYAPKELPEVLADPDKTKQVLVNLINNAIKYTLKGKVEITTEVKRNKIICKVLDTGLGISNPEQKKLFQKFYRVKTEKTRSITGTGLGLWITKSLIEMMDGEIGVKSVEEKGSEFFFSLPKA